MMENMVHQMDVFSPHRHPQGRGPGRLSNRDGLFFFYASAKHFLYSKIFEIFRVQ